MCQYLEKGTGFHSICICGYLKVVYGSIVGFSMPQNLFPDSHGNFSKGLGIRRVRELFSCNAQETYGPKECCWNGNGYVINMAKFCLLGLRVSQCVHKAVCMVFVWSLMFVAVTLVMWEQTVASHASVTTMQTVLVQTN
jgi:hypothetical protein